MDISREPHVFDETKPTAPMVFGQIPVPNVTKVKVSIHVPAPDVGKNAGIFGNDDSTPIESVQSVPAVWQVELPKGLYDVRLCECVANN